MNKIPVILTRGGHLRRRKKPANLRKRRLFGKIPKNLKKHRLHKHRKDPVMLPKQKVHAAKSIHQRGAKKVHSLRARVAHAKRKWGKH